MNSYAD